MQTHTAYLKECLAYHSARLKHFDELPVRDFNRKLISEKIPYHTKQVKWFMRKLSEPVRSTPTIREAVFVPPRDWEDVIKNAIQSRIDLNSSLSYTKPTPVKDFFRRALNRIRGV